MKLSPAEQDSLIQLLTRIYLDIVSIEAEYKLLSGEGDFRPRIEYFHDAVRAFSSQDPSHMEPGGRLSVELLAYDLSCLRFLAAMPLAPFKPHSAHNLEALSPQTDMVEVKSGLTVKTKRPDRDTKERLGHLYQHYGVLFAALLKPIADKDYKERTDTLNHGVEDIAAAAHALESRDVTGLAAAIRQITDEELRDMLQALMQKKRPRGEIAHYLKELAARKDKEIATIDAAHLNYAMSQLGLYEGSKDMLKSLAGQGMNLVGRFVENAMREARREMGR